MGAKVHLMRDADGFVEYAFHCPGCEGGHMVRTKGAGPNWGFNDDLERPTFTPSIRVQHYFGQEPSGVCHSFVKDGKIQFCNDTTHALSGQTVDLPDWDE